MPDKITITLPLPPKELSPNARVHWARRAKAAKGYRTLAWAEARTVANFACLAWTPAERIAVQAIFYHRLDRRRDKDNALASLKPAFDGLADAGIIENDSGIVHLPVCMKVDLEEPPHVELIIECLDEAPGDPYKHRPMTGHWPNRDQDGHR